MTKKWNEKETLDAIEKFKKGEKDPVFIERRDDKERRQIFISPHLLKEDRRTQKDRRG